MTMKTTLSVYDADKTGMVDYALESAGRILLFYHFLKVKTNVLQLWKLL